MSSVISRIQATTLTCIEDFLCDCTNHSVTSGSLYDFQHKHDNYVDMCTRVDNHQLRTSHTLRCEGKATCYFAVPLFYLEV